MKLQPVTLSTRTELARLLLLWLVAVLCLQGLAAARALALGPNHQHAVLEGAATLTPMMVHASAKTALEKHAHQSVERHHHSRLETSPLTTQQDSGLDGVTTSLLMALSLALTPTLTMSLPKPLKHSVAPSAALVWASHNAQPPRRPPRVQRLR